MQLKVTLNRKKATVAFNGKTINQLAVKMGVNHETVIIKKNGVLAHPDEVLKNGDKVEFVGIIYGG